MRIAILAFGSRGDTQPCIALGRGLAERGHDITLVAAARYAPLVAAAVSSLTVSSATGSSAATAAQGATTSGAAVSGRGAVPNGGAVAKDAETPGDAPRGATSASAAGGVLGGGGMVHVPLSVDPVRIVESAAGQAWLRSGPLGFVRGFRGVVEPLAERLVAEVDAACAGADLVLAPALGAFGRHLHDLYGTPYMIMHFQPSEPTVEFPNPLIPARTLGRLGNRASYALIERIAWLMLGRMVNRLRARMFGLGALRGNPFAADRRDRVPVLCGVSSLVVPRPRDWPAWVGLTGYWQVPGSGLPDELDDFLGAGAPPVYVGFGSMIPSSPEAVAAEVIAATKGLRVVVQRLPVEASDDVFVAGDVAHDLLFPRMAAVVHHGGAGTTGTGLTAGVPNVVCPFFSDQPFWGRRVEALGAGPAPLPMAELSAEALAGRLRLAVQNVEKSAQLGRRLRVEDGVKKACDLIEQR